MNLLKLKLFLLALGCLFAVSCANKTLIRDSEYNPVYQALSQKNANEALLNFPDKEENGFITTFEKAWIKFWTDKEKFTPEDIQVVQNLSDQIEKRKFVSISHEASVFLVGESEDGYIPSEHEIISLHLFLSMLYLDAGNRDAAHVELKRAVEYLANNPEGKETTFDDPAIRLWLASLWEAIGDRDHADVDLRKTMELSGHNLTPLLNNQKRKIVLLMSGVGPKTEWSLDGENMIFKYSLIHDDEQDRYAFSTRQWFQWHQNRNTNIRNSLVKSHYMAEALSYSTTRVSKRTLGFAASTAMFVGAVAVAAGGTYALIQVASAPNAPADSFKAIIGLTLLGIKFFMDKSADITKYVDEKIEAADRNQEELRKTYRMIRFLPSNIEYIDENLAKNKSAPHLGYRKTLGAENNQVEFIWNPE